MNIFLSDHDNRDIISLIYHYCKLGHRVFMPRPGTIGFGHQPTWPRLLLKSSSDKSKRNLELYGYEKYDEVKFGEDRFISTEIDELQHILYEKDVSCELIDIEKDHVDIDVWHATPNTITMIDQWFSFAQKYFPSAKWISSCMTHWDHSLKHNPKNLVKFLPANYRNIRPDLNQVGMYRNRIEFEVLNVDYDFEKERNGWASFNHNFSVRQPLFYSLQNRINETLKEQFGEKLQIQNFGGNVRQVGADPKFSGENGVTGKDVTLSPRQAMKKYTELRGVLHLKQADWAGGVPTMSRMSKTPIVVTSKYVADTLSDDILSHGFNCLIANNEQELIDHIVSINFDNFVWKRLSEGQDETNKILFSEEYWKGWEEFLSKLS